MGVTIKKVVLHNFKKFKDFSADFRDGKNIIVGENESGKSTLLTAIDLTLSASFAKVEHIGFENLFNTDSIEHFKKLSKGERCFPKLPILSVDIYLKGLERHEFDGYTNHKRDSDCGIRLEFSLLIVYNIYKRLHPKPLHQRRRDNDIKGTVQNTRRFPVDDIACIERQNLQRVGSQQTPNTRSGQHIRLYAGHRSEKPAQTNTQDSAEIYGFLYICPFHTKGKQRIFRGACTAGKNRDTQCGNETRLLYLRRRNQRLP